MLPHQAPKSNCSRLLSKLSYHFAKPWLFEIQHPSPEKAQTSFHHIHLVLLFLFSFSVCPPWITVLFSCLQCRLTPISKRLEGFIRSICLCQRIREKISFCAAEGKRQESYEYPVTVWLSSSQSNINTLVCAGKCRRMATHCKWGKSQRLIQCHAATVEKRLELSVKS